MFISIIRNGAEMGPGTGWFHPAQSRYGWDWLSGRFDADRDRSISADELSALPALFAALDRDGNGEVTKDDLDWSANSTYLRGRSQARGKFGQLDTNSNGRISREEWDKFFEAAAAGKAHLTSEDLANALYGMPARRVAAKDEPPKPPAPGEGPPTRLMLIDGLLKGEIGSPFEGPSIGDPAPDFALKTFQLDRTIRLSELRGKPVVLVFGSFT